MLKIDFGGSSIQKDPKQSARIWKEHASSFCQILDQNKFKDIIKIKTIGSTYMAASGITESAEPGEDAPRWGHLSTLVEFALELKKALSSINEQSFNHFVLKMGINHGPVTAGVIGARKPHYDIWGNTVNVASRMESTGKVGCIQVKKKKKLLFFLSRRKSRRKSVAGHGRDPQDPRAVRLRLRAARPGVREGQGPAAHPLSGFQGRRLVEPGQRPAGRAHPSDHLSVGAGTTTLEGSKKKRRRRRNFEGGEGTPLSIKDLPRAERWGKLGGGGGGTEKLGWLIGIVLEGRHDSSRIIKRSLFLTSRRRACPGKEGKKMSASEEKFCRKPWPAIIVHRARRTGYKIEDVTQN